MSWRTALQLLLVAASTAAAEASVEEARVLSLDEAVRVGMARQPQIVQAQATADVAAARADEVRTGLLPQLVGAATYQRSTANYVSRPGALPTTTPLLPAASGASYDYYNASLTLSQLVWDFGQTTNRWRAARVGAHAQEETAEAQRQQTLLQIRTSYFTAQAAQELVDVARDALRNSARHLVQIRAFVEVGTRPEIDVAQALTARANAEVRVIQAENDDVAAKAQLNAAMGVERDTAFAVSDQDWPGVSAEADGADTLVAGALERRPDARAAETQIVAQGLALGAARSGYWPALVVGGTASEAGPSLDRLTWNWSAQVGLTWTFLQGGLTPAQVREQRSQLRAATAARDGVRQVVRLEIVQAANAVRAQRAALGAATQALDSARHQLVLAEARYDTGMGSALELDDAQLAVTDAGAQLVSARFALSTARAQIAKALGVAAP